MLDQAVSKLLLRPTPSDVLGLALRYALLLGLDRAAIAPFHGPIDAITENDVCRLRVWYNLLNCDFNLMLISGLPASVIPAPSAQVAGRFASSIFFRLRCP